MNLLAHYEKTERSPTAVLPSMRSMQGRMKEGVAAVFRRCSGHALRKRTRSFSFRLLRHYALCAIFFSTIFLLAAPSRAQVSKEYQLKAVFLLRLAQFTQWPTDVFASADSPLVICVLGENPFGDALDAALRGETAHGRRLAAQRQRAVDQIKGCHMLFVAAAGPRQSKEITAALAGRSVLTVADDDALPSAYDAMVRFATEQNKIKLRVNPKAAAAARLVLDPRLLRAAEIVGHE